MSTPAALQRFLIQHPEAAFTAAAEEIHASITLAKDGTFVTTNPKFTARVAQVVLLSAATVPASASPRDC